MTRIRSSKAMTQVMALLLSTIVNLFHLTQCLKAGSPPNNLNLNSNSNNNIGSFQYPFSQEEVSLLRDIKPMTLPPTGLTEYGAGLRKQVLNDVDKKSSDLARNLEKALKNHEKFRKFCENKGIEVVEKLNGNDIDDDITSEIIRETTNLGQESEVMIIETDNSPNKIKFSSYTDVLFQKVLIDVSQDQSQDQSQNLTGPISDRDGTPMGRKQSTVSSFNLSLDMPQSSLQSSEHLYQDYNPGPMASFQSEQSLSEHHDLGLTTDNSSSLQNQNHFLRMDASSNLSLSPSQRDMYQYDLDSIFFDWEMVMFSNEVFDAAAEEKAQLQNNNSSNDRASLEQRHRFDPPTIHSLNDQIQSLSSPFINPTNNLTPDAKFLLLLFKLNLLQGLVYDCDGTLIHSMLWYEYTWDWGLHQKGMDIPLARKDRMTYHEFMKTYGGQTPEAIRKGLIRRSDEYRKEVLDKYIENHSDSIKVNNPNLKYPEGLQEMLDVNEDNYSTEHVNMRYDMEAKQKFFDKEAYKDIAYRIKTNGDMADDIKTVTDPIRWIGSHYNRVISEIKKKLEMIEDKMNGTISITESVMIDRDVTNGNEGNNSNNDLDSSDSLNLIKIMDSAESSIPNAQRDLDTPTFSQDLQGASFDLGYYGSLNDIGTTNNSDNLGHNLNSPWSILKSKFQPQNAIKLAVASSSDAAAVFGHLKHKKIVHYLDVVAGASRTNAKQIEILFPDKVTKSLSNQPLPKMYFRDFDQEVSKPRPHLFAQAAKEISLSPEYLCGFEDANNGIAALTAARFAGILDVTNFELHPDFRAFVVHFEKGFVENVKKGIQIQNQTKEDLSANSNDILLPNTSNVINTVIARDLQRWGILKEVLVKFEKLHHFALVCDDNKSEVEEFLKSTELERRVLVRGPKDRMDDLGGEFQSFLEFFDAVVYGDDKELELENLNCGESDPLLKKQKITTKSNTHDDDALYLEDIQVCIPGPLTMRKLACKRMNILPEKCISFEATSNGLEQAIGDGIKRPLNILDSECFGPESCGNTVPVVLPRDFNDIAIKRLEHHLRSVEPLIYNDRTKELTKNQASFLYKIRNPVSREGPNRSYLQKMILEKHDHMRSCQHPGPLVFDKDGTLVDSMPVYYRFLEKTINNPRRGLESWGKEGEWSYPTLSEFLVAPLAGNTPDGIWYEITKRNMDKKLIELKKLDKKLLPPNYKSILNIDETTGEILSWKDEHLKKVQKSAQDEEVSYMKVGLPYKSEEEEEEAKKKFPIWPVINVLVRGWECGRKIALATSSRKKKAQEELEKIMVVAGGQSRSLWSLIDSDSSMFADSPELHPSNLPSDQVQANLPDVKKHWMFKQVAIKLKAPAKICTAFEDAVVGITGALRAGYGGVVDVRNSELYPHYKEFVRLREIPNKEGKTEVLESSKGPSSSNSSSTSFNLPLLASVGKGSKGNSKSRSRSRSTNAGKGKIRKPTDVKDLDSLKCVSSSTKTVDMSVANVAKSSISASTSTDYTVPKNGYDTLFSILSHGLEVQEKTLESVAKNDIQLYGQESVEHVIDREDFEAIKERAMVVGKRDLVYKHLDKKFPESTLEAMCGV